MVIPLLLRVRGYKNSIFWWTSFTNPPKKQQKIHSFYFCSFIIYRTKWKNEKKFLCNSWCKIHEFFFLFYILTIYACTTFFILFSSNSFFIFTWISNSPKKMQFKLYEICMVEWRKKEREKIYFSYIFFIPMTASQTHLRTHIYRFKIYMNNISILLFVNFYDVLKWEVILLHENLNFLCSWSPFKSSHSIIVFIKIFLKCLLQFWEIYGRVSGGKIWTKLSDEKFLFDLLCFKIHISMNFRRI